MQTGSSVISIIRVEEVIIALGELKSICLYSSYVVSKKTKFIFQNWYPTLNKLQIVETHVNNHMISHANSVKVVLVYKRLHSQVPILFRWWIKFDLDFAQILVDWSESTTLMLKYSSLSGDQAWWVSQLLGVWTRSGFTQSLTARAKHGYTFINKKCSNWDRNTISYQNGPKKFI